MRIRQFAILGPIAAACALICGTAFAAFPEKAITIVVPTAPGGGNDAMARVVGQAMSALLKQPVIIDNKAGANGAIASEYVAKASPDGYTLMFGYIATHAMNPSLQKLRYDPVKDFEPVGMVGSSATLMVANPGVKAASAKELVPLLKASPDKFSYASAGNGTAPHFAAEMFKLARPALPCCTSPTRALRPPSPTRMGWSNAGDVSQPLHRHAVTSRPAN